MAIAHLIVAIIDKIIYIILLLRLIGNLLKFYKKDKELVVIFFLRLIDAISNPIVRYFKNMIYLPFDFAPLIALSVLAYLVDPILRFVQL